MSYHSGDATSYARNSPLPKIAGLVSTPGSKIRPQDEKSSLGPLYPPPQATLTEQHGQTIFDPHEPLSQAAYSRGQILPKKRHQQYSTVPGNIFRGYEPPDRSGKLAKNAETLAANPNTSPTPLHQVLLHPIPDNYDPLISHKNAGSPTMANDADRNRYSDLDRQPHWRTGESSWLDVLAIDTAHEQEHPASAVRYKNSGSPNRDGDENHLNSGIFYSDTDKVYRNHHRDLDPNFDVRQKTSSHSRASIGVKLHIDTTVQRVPFSQDEVTDPNLTVLVEGHESPHVTTPTAPGGYTTAPPRLHYDTARGGYTTAPPRRDYNTAPTRLNYSTAPTRLDYYPKKVCSECEKVFNGKYAQGNLNRHLRYAHKDVTLTAVQCKSCFKLFKRPDNRHKHERTCQGRNTASTVTLDPPLGSRDQDPNQDKPLCQYCQEAFATRDDAELHEHSCGMNTAKAAETIHSDSGYRSGGLGTDTGSVCSVDSMGSSLGIPPNFLQDFVAFFGDTVIEQANVRKWANESLASRSSEEIEKCVSVLLKEYAVDLARSKLSLSAKCVASSTTQGSEVIHGAIDLIRRYRPKIARYFRENVISAPVSEISLSLRLQALGDQLSLNERLGLFQKSTILNELQTQAPDDEQELEDIQEAENLFTDLAYVKEALVSGAAFHNLIRKLQRAFQPCGEGQLAIIENVILKAFMPSDHADYSAQFSADLDILNFMHAHFGKRQTSISTIVVLVGSIHDAEGTTCGEYIRRTWPDTGEFFLEILEAAVENARRGAGYVSKGRQCLCAFNNCAYLIRTP